MPASRGTRAPDAATARLSGWIEPVVASAGFDLEELVVTPAGRRSVVRVVVDRDEGVSLDDIAEVSRAVSAVLDEKDGDLGRAPYVLEVTSPGVDRPLVEPRHWRRNRGRLVSVAVGTEREREEVTARIAEVGDDGVTLLVEAAAKPGAKKRPPAPRSVPWSQLGAGRVQVEFGRPAGGDDPVDDDGPDGEADAEHPEPPERGDNAQHGEPRRRRGGGQ